MGSDAVIYVPSFIKIGSGIQKAERYDAVSWIEVLTARNSNLARYIFRGAKRVWDESSRRKRKTHFSDAVA
jgi:hypothetical protein